MYQVADAPSIRESGQNSITNRQPKHLRRVAALHRNLHEAPVANAGTTYGESHGTVRHVSQTAVANRHLPARQLNFLTLFKANLLRQNRSFSITEIINKPNMPGHRIYMRKILCLRRYIAALINPARRQRQKFIAAELSVLNPEL